MKSKVIFKSEVVCGDDFYDLTDGAQRLYYRLNAEANQDGRCTGVRQIVRAIDCDLSDLAALVAAGFVLDCGNGAYFVRDWWLHNTYDAHNARHVGESPELLDGLVVFAGQACKSQYCLVDTDKDDESLPKVCEQTCNGNGKPTGTANQREINGNPTESANATAFVRENGIETVSPENEFSGHPPSRCPNCGQETLPPSKGADGSEAYDCCRCGKVVRQSDGSMSCERW